MNDYPEAPEADYVRGTPMSRAYQAVSAAASRSAGSVDLAVTDQAEAIERLASALERADLALAELESRLQTVFTEVPDEIAGDRPVNPRNPASSRLAATVSEHTDRIEQATLTVHRLTDRIGVDTRRVDL